VAEQAMQGCDSYKPASVFASAAADIRIADQNCTAVSQPAPALSPTKFHNSVHNAAAGYWSIATASHAPANSLSGGDDSFAVALCDAWAKLAVEHESVLMVCFEALGTGMLQEAWRDVHDSFAVALLLSRRKQGAIARLTRPVLTAAAPTPVDERSLEHFRHCNPAARSLVLLTALARSEPQTVVVESGQGNLLVEVEPCA